MEAASRPDSSKENRHPTKARAAEARFPGNSGNRQMRTLNRIPGTGEQCTGRWKMQDNRPLVTSQQNHPAWKTQLTMQNLHGVPRAARTSRSVGTWHEGYGPQSGRHQSVKHLCSDSFEKTFWSIVVFELFQLGMYNDNISIWKENVIFVG